MPGSEVQPPLWSFNLERKMDIYQSHTNKCKVAILNTGIPWRLWKCGGFQDLWPTAFQTLNVHVCGRWKWKSLSHLWLFATPWTIQSMKFSRPEYWSGQPFPSPGIKPRSLSLQADSLPAELPGKPNLVKIQLDLGIWSGTWDFAFLTSSQVMPMFLVLESNLDYKPLLIIPWMGVHSS